MDALIQRAVDALRACPFIAGIVLGGSRATGMATENSDVDIGVYYRHGQLNAEMLSRLAQELDDQHRENLVCGEGGWGPWVNCGGWLVMDGVHVDLILRDMDRVQEVVERTDRGEFSAHYQTGHPHAFLDVMYRGELASCQLLYAADPEFSALKSRAENYPIPLQRALMQFFLFEAEFSCALAEKNLPNGDLYYFTGHLFRAASALNQALFARNAQWCLNEKKAIFRIDGFPMHPQSYAARMNHIFTLLGTSPQQALATLQTLRQETIALCHLPNA